MDIRTEPMEDWGEGSHPGPQGVSQQLEVPPSSCTTYPPLGPPPGKPGAEPREETKVEEIKLAENEIRIEDERQIRDTAKETGQKEITEITEKEVMIEKDRQIRDTVKETDPKEITEADETETGEKEQMRENPQEDPLEEIENADKDERQMRDMHETDKTKKEREKEEKRETDEMVNEVKFQVKSDPYREGHG